MLVGISLFRFWLKVIISLLFLICVDCICNVLSIVVMLGLIL